MKGGCLLPVLLGLITPLTTGQPRAFQGSPNDRTVFVDERANFSCVVADSSVHWRVNETDVDDLPGDDIVTEAVEVGGLHVYTMVLPGRIEYNQTRIKCVFTHISGTLIESDTAILTVVPYKEEREDNQNDLFDEQSDEVPTSSTPPDIDMIGENGNKSSTPSGEGSDHAGIITGGVIGAVVAVLTSITVIVVLFNRKKICGDKLVFCKDKWLSVEQEEEREGFRVIAEVSTPGEDYEEKATVEEPHSDKHTSIEVEESTRDGVWTSKLEESSNEGKAEVVGVHRIVRQTARTLSTERAMLSEDMPEGKHGPYISAPTLQEHISISIDEETDDMELQDLSVPREKDPQGSLATVSGKETFPRVPSSSNIQSYLNKPPLNGAKKDDSVLNDYRSSVPAASSKARDRKASFPQECSETIVHIDGSERIVCIPSGSSPINQAVQGHEHDDNLDITVEKGTSAKATVDENDTDASGDLPSPNLSSSEGEAEHSQRPNGTVTTDDLACGHESDASVNETKGQAKSVSSSQDADMVTHGTSSDLLNEDCSGCHIKCNNRISAAVSAELQGHTAIETASCEEPCASVNKVSPPSKKSQLTSDVIVPG